MTASFYLFWTLCCQSSSSSSFSLPLSLSLSLSLFIRPYHPSLQVGPLDRIQYPHRADGCKTFLVNQHWQVYVQIFIRGRRLWACPHFIIGAYHVMWILLEWFMRWVVSCCIGAVWGNVGSRNCSKLHIAFLRSFSLHDVSK